MASVKKGYLTKTKGVLWSRRLVLIMIVFLPFSAFFASSIGQKALVEISYLIIFVVISLRFFAARCPKCGKRFFFRIFENLKSYETVYDANFFRDDCANCGLKIK